MALKLHSTTFLQRAFEPNLLPFGPLHMLVTLFLFFFLFLQCQRTHDETVYVGRVRRHMKLRWECILRPVCEPHIASSSPWVVIGRSSVVSYMNSWRHLLVTRLFLFGGLLLHVAKCLEWSHPSRCLDCVATRYMVTRSCTVVLSLLAWWATLHCLLLIAVGTCHAHPCHIFAFVSSLSLVGVALVVGTLCHCCFQRFVQLPPLRVRTLPLTVICTCLGSYVCCIMMPIVWGAKWEL